MLLPLITNERSELIMKETYWQVIIFNSRERNSYEELLYGKPYESRRFKSKHAAEVFLHSIANNGVLNYVTHYS